MIICSSSNIDLVQGVLGYGNPEGITDWRIANTLSGANGNLNIFNSISQTSRLTILENGNVGIGNTNPGSIMDIVGDVNITGVYKKGNRDIISDTSNYVVVTSNILVSRVFTEVGHGSNYTNRLITALNTRVDDTSNYVVSASNVVTTSVNSQWMNVSSGIYYTPTTAESLPYAITSSPVATTIGATGDYTYMSFTYTTETAGAGTGQTQYTLNVPSGGAIFDILVVGGGGAGGGRAGGGGGAGGVLYREGISLSGSITIKVGNGGVVGTASNGDTSQAPGLSGFSSSIGALYIAAGGGGGGGNAPHLSGRIIDHRGKDGGSGGGNCSSAFFSQNDSTNGYNGNPNTFIVGKTLKNNNYSGNNGGKGISDGGSTWTGGGGGGAGASGGNAGYNSKGGDGIPIRITGSLNYYGGGGGGGANNASAIRITDGGLGGGGNGTAYAGNGFPGISGTGGGGGGGGFSSDSPSGSGGVGGSGIVIIRYLSSTKNVGIGITNPSTELHVYDDTINNTIVTVQNDYIDPVVIYPNTSQGSTLPTPLYTSVPTGVTTGTIGTTDRYYIFTHTGGFDTNTVYSIPIPAGITFDVLMIGGGGAGGAAGGAGGGAGACLLAFNQTISGGTYNFTVAGGGSANNINASSNGNSGYNTFIGTAATNFYLARGGGGGGAGTKNGIIGGCSGGASGGIDNLVYTSPSPATDNIFNIITSGPVVNNTQQYAIYGNKGGDTTAETSYNNINYSGGGGIGSAAANANTITKATTGGDGLYQVVINNITYNLRTYFTNNGTFGVQDGTTGNYYIGGGGAGGGYNPNITPINISGGRGGGGIGYNGNTTMNGGHGTPNTGSGGGGASTGINGPTSTYGGNGGSGLLIFRYRNTAGYTAVETVESGKLFRTLTFNYIPNYPENPPNTSLLAWYRFDGDGLDYNPYATKYNLIANTGTPTYSSGTTADSFLQGRRYINTAAGSLRSTTLALQSRAFSIALWIRPKSTSETYFIGQGSADGINRTFAIGFRANIGYVLPFGGNDLECGTGVSGNPTTYPGDVNTWVHIVYVVLPNYNRRMYRNGVLISQDSNTSAFTGPSDFKVGLNPWTVALNNIDISDIRIYSNGLSATEVATLYASYTNLVITDNYAINFNKSTTLLVNSVSKTVNGLYNLSMGHINSSMLPAGGQTDTPLASTAITYVPIKYEYTSTSFSLPSLITVAGATSSIIGTTERAISFAYTSDSAGLTGQTLYSFTPTEDLWCDILVVGGGGGGGCFGGGGGGGGVLLGTNLKINSGSSVSIKVAKGGTGSATLSAAVNGTNGFDSSITISSIEYIAKGGGGGGSRGAGSSFIGTNGNAGGSGGGGSQGDTGTQSLGGVSNKNNYANFQSFGNNGGRGKLGNTGSPTHSHGGGGGAGSVGSDFSSTTGGGNGGLGKEFITYFGTNVGHNGYFAGGGGGNTYTGAGNRGYGNGGLGFYGGGGDGGYDGTIEYFAEDGLPNTGGGGGGSKGDGGIAEDLNGGNGGTGFVIIRYRKNQAQSSSLELITTKQLPNELVVSGTTSTSTGTFDRCIVFPYITETISGSGQTQYNFSITEELICDILVVAGGGGGGGQNAGGGGAGGLVLIQNITLSGNFTINVGNGGSGRTGDNSGLPGINSTLTKSDNTIIITANGGGRGGNTFDIGGNGGSGGGGGFIYSNGTQTQKSQSQIGIVSPTIINQFGENGGHGGSGVGNSYPGGGGGGAGGVGSTSPGDETGQNGGLGIDRVGEFIFKEKFNSSVGDYGWFAGGGASAGGYQNTNYAYGNGGASMFGGGGNGDGVGRGINGINGTGGGGGGARLGAGGGRGGSGIVIIRYRSSKIGTQGYKIGNYNGDFKIISTNSSTNTDYLRITRDGASIYNPTGSPLWSTTSDKRIKENIEKASYDTCYDNINKLDLYRFNYIKDFNNINKDLRQLGYIAQEVQGIFPKAVSAEQFYNNNLSVPDLLTIDITQINYSLYGTVKKLMEMYNDIENQISIVENLLNIDASSITTTSDNLVTADISTSNNLVTVDVSTSNNLVTADDVS